MLIAARTSSLLVLRGEGTGELSRPPRPRRDVRRPARCRYSTGVLGNRRASLITRRRLDGRSGRAPFVSMMKATDLRDSHGGAIAGRRDRTRNRRVFVQRQVRTGPFVVRTVAGHQPQQACFIEHDHVIETVATSRSNQSFDEWILPRVRLFCIHQFRTCLPIVSTIAIRILTFWCA